MNQPRPEPRSTPSAPFPQVRTAGFDGLIVRFADSLSEPANRAALAFRAAVETQGWEGVEETSTTLVSAFVRFDPLAVGHAEMQARLEALLAAQDWFAAPLPSGRRLWRVPTVFGTDLAPQLAEAAALVGMTEEEAIASLSQARVRVQTIGFAPGQPYLGQLPEVWDIPRQQKLTDNVPAGALVVAIRQLVLFSVTTPTGWRHVGQTRLRLFRPEAEEPFVLRPGDEMIFEPVSPEELARRDPGDGSGGAVAEPLS